MLSPEDKAVLSEWEALAKRLTAKFTQEADGTVANAIMLEKKLYHQFLHFMVANRSRLSPQGQMELEGMEHPEPHMMFPPETA